MTTSSWQLTGPVLIFEDPAPILEDTGSSRSSVLRVWLNDEHWVDIPGVPRWAARRLVSHRREANLGELTRGLDAGHRSVFGELCQRLQLAGVLVPQDRPPLYGRTITIAGEGRLALEVTQQALSAGVGTLVLQTVSEQSDIRDWLTIHQPRNVLRRTAAPHEIEWHPTELVIVAPDSPTWDPLLMSRLTTAGVAHLVLRATESTAMLGPLVHPGVTPCLECLSLQAAVADPRHPQQQEQLSHVVCHPPKWLATVAAAQTLLAATEFLHRGHCPGLAGQIRAAPSEPRADHVSWSRHPHCRCTALTRLLRARSSGVVRAAASAR